MNKKNDLNFNLGVQPLDELMNKNGWTNNFVVKNSSAQLTHKQIQKGRKGRRLTTKIQDKILQSINECLYPNKITISDLFTYYGKKNLRD